MNTLALREKRNKIWNAAKDFLESKRGENGMISPEAVAEYEKMEADVVNLGKEIDRLERQAAFDLELGKATSNAVTNTPTAPEAEKTGRASNEYRVDFRNVLRGIPTVHAIFIRIPRA